MRISLNDKYDLFISDRSRNTSKTADWGTPLGVPEAVRQKGGLPMWPEYVQIRPLRGAAEGEGVEVMVTLEAQVLSRLEELLSSQDYVEFRGGD